MCNFVHDFNSSITIKMTMMIKIIRPILTHLYYLNSNLLKTNYNFNNSELTNRINSSVKSNWNKLFKNLLYIVALFVLCVESELAYGIGRMVFIVRNSIVSAKD